MKKPGFWITIMILLMVMLSGCMQQPASEATIPPTQQPAETVVETVPSTQPATESPTQPPEETAPPTEPEPEPEPVAELIEEGVKILVGGTDCTRFMSDGNHKTLNNVYDKEIVVESETPFSTMYIEWNRVPGIYSIVWDGGSIECGQYGFLHEYIRLPEAITRAHFEFTEGEYHALCDVEVLTAGSAPEGIQDWLPPCDEADILVFPTHSDDDVLFFGPLISYYAAQPDLVLQTAFMVEHTFYPERGHERLNGLWTMGVRYYPILGTAPDSSIFHFDHAMSFYASSNIEQWQVEQIRRFKPLVVVGHDLNGEYGNGGHKVNAYFLTQAVESAANPEAYPELAEQYGVWDTPKLYLHLYEENEIILDVEVALENDPLGRTPFEIATEAFKCHVSQHDWPYRVQYGELRAYDCRPFGLYRTLVGYDTMADIMENIQAERWRNADSQP